MDPLWEYQYLIKDGPFGMKPTGFYLTDEEAALWPRSKEETTKRMDETKRDRNAQKHPGYGFGHLYGGKR